MFLQSSFHNTLPHATYWARIDFQTISDVTNNTHRPDPTLRAHRKCAFCRVTIQHSAGGTRSKNITDGGALNYLYCVNMMVITKASISKPRQKNRTKSVWCNWPLACRTFTEMSAVQRTPLFVFPSNFFHPFFSLSYLFGLYSFSSLWQSFSPICVLIWHS